MTIETRATIQLGDILAIEYECPGCHAKSIRPINLPDKSANRVPVACGNCNAPWMTEHSQVTRDLATLLNLIAILGDGGTRLPFVLRLEVSGIDKVSAREGR